MERKDILADRDWFLIVLLWLGFAGVGANLMYVAHFLLHDFAFGAIMAGLFLLAPLVLLPLYLRYHRLAFVALVAVSALQLIVGVAQALDGQPRTDLQHFGGYVNGVIGLVFLVGLLARWGSFMGGGRTGEPGPAS